MRPLLLAVAAAAAFGAALGVFREIVRFAAASPIPADLTPDEVYGDRFTRALLLPPLPIAVFTLIGGLAAILPWQSFEAAMVGLLLTAAAMALVLQTLCSELLLWSHRARRMDAGREAQTIERLRRAGAMVNEVWVSPSPIVIFWRFSLLVPAVLVRSRALLWEDALAMPAAGAGGVVLTAPVARYWPWAAWPLAAAIALRVRDPYSVLPWWMFAIAFAVIAVAAAPDLFAWVRLRQCLRSDAGVREEIRGAITLGLIEARLAAARALRDGVTPGEAGFGGLMARWSAASAWNRALRRARRAAKLAGIPLGEILAETGASADLRF